MKIEDLRNSIGNSFKIAIAGAVICTISSILDILTAVKETNSFEIYSSWLLIVGALVWGIGLIGAGNKICKTGHTETGVVSAGGAMIFWAIALIAYQLFADENSMGHKDVSLYVWLAVTLLGPVIFYFSLKQDEDKEDHFLGWAAFGMGAVILSELLAVGIIWLLNWTADGGGVTYHHAGDYTIVTQSSYSVLGEWIAENFKLVIIILASLSTLGYILCLGCMANYKGFVDELQEVERQVEREKLVDELLKKHETEKAGSDLSVTDSNLDKVPEEIEET